jgi:phosphoglycolate phosphatase-like HAD superfamily hydrolase
VICGDTLEFNKPHPAPLLFACDKLSSLPSKCLFVGDDINDMIAGKRAGMKTVAVDYGYGKINSEWNYDYRIQNVEEILDLL